MEPATKCATPTTTTTSPSKQHNQLVSPHAENLNPNVSCTTTASMCPKSINAVIVVRSPQTRIRQRKFLVAKKRNNNKNKTALSCTCEDKVETAKCVCVAYENLRASQEEFFSNKEAKACDNNNNNNNNNDDDNNYEEEEEEAENAFIEASLMIQDLGIDDDGANEERGEIDNEDEEGSSAYVKRRRDKLLEEARNSVPESGSGRVMHLVKAFEKLLSMPKSKGQREEKEEEENGEHGYGESNGKIKSKIMKWALPGMHFDEPPNAPETEVSGSSSSFCLRGSDLVLTSENLGLDSRVSVSSSWDSSSGRMSSGARRSRRNSLESCSTFGGRRWEKKKKLKVTSQKPFNLRTEQRGKLKEEEFVKKIQEMLAEEQKMRVPIAQGLPWTTDEPECLVKPPVKDSTRPIDLKLHSDIRAIDRAEFDQQVAEKMSLTEQLKLEGERQQKLEEEEEIRRLRKELIPKAQPMPYFDRPFVPRRSMKHPTIPREPKFHIPQHKKIKCCSSWKDMNPCSSYQN